ncbi:helix-turn-helix domain-containing protein [Tardiphaga sp. vice154]|uniref:helix-turn-helix domain-containing protein n=1 Tax=Tardiphaga sp. vice154 TaxID=2592814 RepID=UPI0011629CA7|nr:helix-turn-helix domain-containing protein [Tardiphaga sp. vice154]QDM22656.1 helix-turn-helix domain-containing protein [Tardiphaga sp. vice154]
MKRHSAEEISSKLQEAEALMARGLSQAQACKKLGVSVMTFHRWRKQDGVQAGLSYSEGASSSLANIAALAPKEDPMTDSRVSELRLENDRLRRIVTDLLLEKMRIEEELVAREQRSK